MKINKLEQLMLLSRDDPTIHRFMVMYQYGEYATLEDLLYEMVIVLSALNKSQQQRLFDYLKNGLPPIQITIEDKDVNIDQWLTRSWEDNRIESN